MRVPAFSGTIRLVTIKLELIAEPHEISTVDDFQSGVEICFKQLDDAKLIDVRKIFLLEHKM